MPGVVLIRAAVPKGIRFLETGEERVSTSGFNDLGVLVGTPRTNQTFLLGRSGGPRGATGKDAYQYAQDEGFTGTLEQWLDAQRGIYVLNPGDPTPDPGTLLNRTLLLERT